MNTTNTNNTARGGFNLDITGDQVIDGQMTIDISGKMKELVGKEIDAKVTLTFSNFKTSGSCSISFEGKAKGSKEIKTKTIV